jgi:aminoacylase
LHFFFLVVEQLIDLSNKALAFRKEQRDILHGNEAAADHSNCAHAIAAKRQKMFSELKTTGKMTLGDVTSLNITSLEAGVRVGDTVAYNCVPPKAKCSLDIRISPHVEPKEIGNMIDGWCQECSVAPEEGSKISWRNILGMGPANQNHALTATDASNPWYQVFASAMAGMGLTIQPQVFPAATDSRFLRELGIKAFGFSPMRNTEIMLHENDEYLEESIFVEGVEVYTGLIHYLASASDLDNGTRTVG